MRTFLHLLYQPYKWLVAIPLMLLSTAICGTLAIIISALARPGIAVTTAGAAWGRSMGWITPMFVSIAGKNNIDKKQSYVIVANHQSFFDVFLICGWLGVDARWVMKKELRKVPFLGIASEKVGHIYVDRTNSESARASIEEAKKRITGGTSVFFFPEGTRSVTGEMGEFKKGAFHMAFDLALPILPITVIGTNKILPSTTMNLFPGRAKMVVHKPVDTSAYSREDMDKLIADVKNIIEAEKLRGAS